MSSEKTPQVILDQIASIDHMERGILSVTRQGPNGPYYNFQCWRDGRNVSEYVPAGQVQQVKENIEAHRHFQKLVGDYERILTEQSREERKAGVKKKRPTRRYPSPGKPKSKIS